MIESRPLKREQLIYSLKSKSENESQKADHLIEATIEFYQKVNLIQMNFQGADYFELNGNFTDLQILLQKMTEALSLFHFQSSSSSIRFEMDFYQAQNNASIESIRSDAERISMIVSGLGNLIQSYKKSSLETAMEESFSKDDPLRNILRELENSHWIFIMFSKY